MSRDPLWEARRKLAQFQTFYSKAQEKHRAKEAYFEDTITELTETIKQLEEADAK